MSPVLIVLLALIYLVFGWATCEAAEISRLWIPFWPLVFVFSE